MNTEVMENIVDEVLGVTPEATSMKDTVIAFGVAGMFMLGVGVTTYYVAKGSIGLAKKLKAKKAEGNARDNVVEVEFEQAVEEPENGNEE